MSKKIYTCDACHYTFEAETGCDQCPDCGKKRVRPADEQESKEYLERQQHTDNWNKINMVTGRSLPLRPVFHNRVI